MSVHKYHLHDFHDHEIHDHHHDHVQHQILLLHLLIVENKSQELWQVEPGQVEKMEDIDGIALQQEQVFWPKK